MKKIYSAVLSLSARCFNRGKVIKGIVVLMMLVGCEVGFGQKIWSGAGTLPGQWSDANNWSPSGVPGAGDQVTLDNSIVGVSYTVTLPTGTGTSSVAQLTIKPLNPANPITLVLPVGNTANLGFTANSFTFPMGIIIDNGGVLLNSSGATAGGSYGVSIGGLATDSMQIKNGGKYIHNTRASSARTATNLSTAFGTNTGIYEYDVPIGTPSFAITTSTAYGNLTLSRSSPATYTASSNGINVRGSFTVNTNVTFNSSLGTSFDLFGDLVNNGTISFPGTHAVNFTGTSTQTISGSGTTTFAGGTTITNASNTLAIATTNPISFGGAVTAHGNLKIISGLMNGTGTWTYDAGNTLTFANTVSYPATGVNNVGHWWPTASGPANITMNGAGGISLDATRTITGTLDLTNGIINNTFELILDAASLTINAKNSSYVNGKVKKIGISDFVFPVGKTIGSTTSYVPIEISNFLSGAVVTDSYTAEYIRASAYTLGPIDPSLIVPLTDVSHLDYWTLDRTVGTGLASANIRAHWTAQSSNGGSAAFILDPTKVVLAQLVASKWTNFGNFGTGSGIAAAGTVDWATWTNATVGSTTNFFSLASTSLDNPLPVTVSYLQGAKQNSGNIINWKVSCISNLNATMILQRSTDNRNFTDITSITATAARCQQPFDYIDITAASGTNYYRLKTINDDGKITYSIVIVIVNKATGFDMVSLLPNIVRSNALLNITSAQKTTLQMVITDAMGRPVQKAAYSLIAGSNQFEITVANLPAGMYRITGITAEGQTKTIAFVKQ